MKKNGLGVVTRRNASNHILLLKTYRGEATIIIIVTIIIKITNTTTALVFKFA